MELVADSDSPAPVLDAAALSWENLDPKARVTWRLGAMIAFALPYAIPAAIALAAWDSAGLSAMTKLGLHLLGLALAAWLGWRFADASYARTTFALSDDGLRIRRGVVWRSETLVPRSRVQHIDLNRGPLDRRFGLASIKVYTAGTRLASVGLDGLPEARAIAVRDQLVPKDDDVV